MSHLNSESEHPPEKASYLTPRSILYSAIVIVVGVILFQLFGSLQG